jgi:hypothetical protein
MLKRRFFLFLWLSFLSLGGGLLACNSEKVWVAKPDGSLQCEAQSGVALSVMKDELKAAHVHIHEAERVSDGKMRAQMCGLPTGWLNSYQINAGDVEKAKSLGFELLSSLQEQEE